MIWVIDPLRFSNEFAAFREYNEWRQSVGKRRVGGGSLWGLVGTMGLFWGLVSTMSGDNLSGNAALGVGLFGV